MSWCNPCFPLISCSAKREHGERKLAEVESTLEEARGDRRADRREADLAETVEALKKLLPGTMQCEGERGSYSKTETRFAHFATNEGRVDPASAALYSARPRIKHDAKPAVFIRPQAAAAGEGLQSDRKVRTIQHTWWGVQGHSRRYRREHVCVDRTQFLPLHR